MNATIGIYKAAISCLISVHIYCIASCVSAQSSNEHETTKFPKRMQRSPHQQFITSPPHRSGLHHHSNTAYKGTAAKSCYHCWDRIVGNSYARIMLESNIYCSFQNVYPMVFRQ